MNFLTFLFPFIELFTSGRFIRKFFAVMYQTFGWLFLVVGVVATLTGIYLSMQTEQLLIIAGALICTPIIAAGGYLLMQISLYRAKTIAELDEADFTAIPIVSNFIRYCGEMFFAILAVQGLFYLVASLFVSNMGFGLMDMLRGYTIPLPDSLMFGNGLLDDLFKILGNNTRSFGEKGLVFLLQVISYLFSLVNGVMVMLFFYFIAEINVVLAEIASNTRRMVVGGPVQKTATAIVGKCTACGYENDAADMFCTDCGGKLKD